MARREGGAKWHPTTTDSMCANMAQSSLLRCTPAAAGGPALVAAHAAAAAAAAARFGCGGKPSDGGRHEITRARTQRVERGRGRTDVWLESGSALGVGHAAGHALLLFCVVGHMSKVAWSRRGGLQVAGSSKPGFFAQFLVVPSFVAGAADGGSSTIGM